MTLTIALHSEFEKRLATQASKEGVAPEEYARRLIEEHLPPEPIESDLKSIHVLDEWERENATEDPEQIARNQKEGEEFMRNLAQNRLDMEGANSRKL